MTEKERNEFEVWLKAREPRIGSSLFKLYDEYLTEKINEQKSV